jgi:hypothetical protein
MEPATKEGIKMIEALSKMYHSDVRVKANYSFWRHPIKWMRDRKARKVMEVLINHWLK